MEENIGLLANWSKYDFTHPVYGIIEPSRDFDPEKKLLNFGNGSWAEVDFCDLIIIENLHPKEIEYLFPE